MLTRCSSGSFQRFNNNVHGTILEIRPKHSRSRRSPRSYCWGRFPRQSNLHREYVSPTLEFQAECVECLHFPWLGAENKRV